MNRCLKILLLGFCALSMAGCGATRFDAQLPETFSMKQGQTLEFPPIENVTGKTLEIPADQVFNEYMGNLLKERKLLNLTPQSAPMVLKTKLIEYEPGSAFGRWLLPGVGTTICTVHAELLDKKTGALIGRLESRQTVSFGGLYSVGAENYICKRAADDLIGELDKRLGKAQEPG